MKRLVMSTAAAGLIFILQGCSSNAHAENFKQSSIESTFPIPADAKEIKKKEDSAVYSLKGMKEEEGLPKAYLAKLEEDGWKESTSEQMGALEIFKKDGKTLKVTSLTDKFIIEK
ncbi:hypothetical protein [Bacillus sp. SJS]|uniref:hypothetical protein n=1 Tax=Bacillus sp. SJS TaxID=1423321 RepID=UPI0004DD7BB9|nr:hypothetical protein [Bacillus sp. SJS]KZZ84718.1 hypothetical protein AS29_009300 [Bacillus sp. SJS]